MLFSSHWVLWRSFLLLRSHLILPETEISVTVTELNELLVLSYELLFYLHFWPGEVSDYFTVFF